jgi:hypothetical protein
MKQSLLTRSLSKKELIGLPTSTLPYVMYVEGVYDSDINVGE